MGKPITMLANFLQLILFFICAAPLMAQGLEEQARKEGKVVLYTTMNATETGSVVDAFKKRYPSIDATFYRTGDEALLNKVETEARLGQHLWDVIEITGFAGYHLFLKGSYAKYDSPERKFFPEGFKDKEGYWTSHYTNSHIVIYNTRMVPKDQAPKTYDDLLHPRWKGKMVLDAKDYEWFANMLKFMGEEKGIAYMRKLAVQDIRMQPGHTLLAQLVAAGEMPLGIAMYGHRAEQMKRQGAPVESVALNPVVLNLHPVALSAKAAHPNAGKLLIDFFLSRDAAKIIQSFNRIPDRPDVPPDPPSLIKGIPILPSDLTLVKDYNRYVKLFREIFKVN